MRELNVLIERNGSPVFVGTIRGNDFRDSRFRYSPEYLGQQDCVPVSLHLPLQEKAFSAENTRIFFEGLLPEGFTRKSVAQWMRVDENDYLSILEGLGKECLGAIQIASPEFALAPPAYEKLSMEQVQALAREGATKSAQLVTQAHLSLTGASGKVGLYYDAENDDWYMPTGDAPSTHIAKQSHIRLGGIVTNEQLCLMTASRLGIPVPKSFIIHTEDARDENVLFATERYDRVVRDNARTISGLRAPHRLHQEDFAQALGISSADKYELPGQSYLKEMFGLLRRVSGDPIPDQLALWNAVVFDYLAGNTDCHLKNFSLLYSEDLKSLRLAPAYDIVSTNVYESTTRDMAFRIGDATRISAISRESFELAAVEVGLGRRVALGALDAMLDGFVPALKDAAEELGDLGFDLATPIRDKILANGGIAFLPHHS